MFLLMHNWNRWTDKDTDEMAQKSL